MPSWNLFFLRGPGLCSELDHVSLQLSIIVVRVSKQKSSHVLLALWETLAVISGIFAVERNVGLVNQSSL
jgi:hypothetical protein